MKCGLALALIIVCPAQVWAADTLVTKTADGKYQAAAATSWKASGDAVVFIRFGGTA